MSTTQRRTIGILATAAACCGALLFGGCAAVQPWEKQLLSDPIMRFRTEHPGAVYEQHLLNSREGSAGGYGGAGGGCGCK